MKQIKLFKPYVSWLARIYVMKVLMGSQLAEGPVVKAFEREFSSCFTIPRKKVVAVNSGTSALELAYELAGIGPGDEVITPVLTCTATNLPLVRRGAKIVFADIDEKTLNISIEDVERKITEKTKAIVFVRFGGSNRGLGQLLVLARRYNLRVIDDAAQAVGYSFAFCSPRADYTCVSLQAIKTLTAGDGGFLICNEEEDADKARRLRWFGYDRDLKQKLGDTDLHEAGYKYHMNDIMAAIGLGNLRSLYPALKRRWMVQEWYLRYFSEAIIGGRLIVTPWLVIMIHPHALEIGRFLKSQNIDCGQHHYRNDKYTVFGRQERTDGSWMNESSWSYVKEDLPLDERERVWKSTVPNMDHLENQYLLLPFHHDLSRKDVKRVIEAIDYWVARKARREKILWPQSCDA